MLYQAVSLPEVVNTTQEYDTDDALEGVCYEIVTEKRMRSVLEAEGDLNLCSAIRECSTLCYSVLDEPQSHFNVETLYLPYVRPFYIRVRDHIKSCWTCREEVMQYKELDEMFGGGK